MACITINADESLKLDINSVKGINWSEFMQDDVIKKVIFEKFLKTHKLSAQDQLFCDSIDWHPVDELPLKESFVKKLEQIEKRKPSGKAMTIDEFEKHWDSL